MSNEGNSNVGDSADVGRVFAHPHVALADQPAARPAASVAGRICFAVISGGLFGFLVSVIVAPSFAFAFAVGGAMSFGAGVVALFLMTSGADDAGITTTARTDAQVEAALVEIKARKT